MPGGLTPPIYAGSEPLSAPSLLHTWIGHTTRNDDTCERTRTRTWTGPLDAYANSAMRSTVKVIKS